MNLRRRRSDQPPNVKLSQTLDQDVIAALFVTAGTPIRDVIETIDRSGRVSVALLVDDEHRLIATITDGDVRRAILTGLEIEAGVESMLSLKATLPNPEPVTAPVGIDAATALAVMQERRVRQLPLVDEDRRVIDIVLLVDLIENLPNPCAR